MATRCNRLIRNAIICWNYLYLSQRLAEEPDTERRQALLAAFQNGSIVLWHHLNLHGEYDFSAALQTCAQGLALDADDAELLFRRAVVHRHRGETTEAESSWRRILTFAAPRRFAASIKEFMDT
jgi:Tn3 transposase DDE domain